MTMSLLKRNWGQNWAHVGSFDGLCGVPWTSFLGGKKSSTENPCVEVFFGPMLGQCWAVWGPCWGHVGAMRDRRDRVTHVGLKLVHVRLLGPCRGHVGPMMLGLCCYVPVGLTFIYYLILLTWAKMFRLESADALMLEELRFCRF
jgi:hypothetical protein